MAVAAATLGCQGGARSRDPGAQGLCGIGTTPAQGSWLSPCPSSEPVSCSSRGKGGSYLGFGSHSALRGSVPTAPCFPGQE